MASELVRIVWCDKHGKQAKVPAPHNDVIAIGRLRKQLDTCDPCYTELVEPLLKALLELGHTVPDFEEPEPNGRTKNEPSYFCKACPSGRGFVRKANYDKHMETEHGLNRKQERAPETDDGKIVCVTCPDHPALTKQGYTGHARSKVHRENLALTA